MGPLPDIAPELLLGAYAQGYFPMAERREDPAIYWFNPERRGVLPLDDFHVPKKLARFLKKHAFEIRVDSAFEDVIRACAETKDLKGNARKGTWINEHIISMYTELHRQGHAHSVECWLPATSLPSHADGAKVGGALMGGLYGVSLGGAFFGESMFSRADNASKVALVHLVELLRRGGYRLLDTQYVNEHLKQFGVQEIAREEYLARLEKALEVQVDEGVWLS